MDETNNKIDETIQALAPVKEMALQNYEKALRVFEKCRETLRRIDELEEAIEQGPSLETLYRIRNIRKRLAEND